MNEIFILTDEYIPLCNLLKFCGVTPSGGMAKSMISAGLVRVDGAIELRKTCKIRAGQIVSGEGFQIQVQHPECP